MRHVTLEARLHDVDARDAYTALCDFDRYVVLTDAVREVRVHGMRDGLLHSDWEVNFRNGILRWSEVDRFDDDAMRIEFTQIDGDFDHFSGSWHVLDGDVIVVRFEGHFDMGIPSLAQIIDPIAERTLAENIAQIIEGLFGDAVEIPGRPARQPIA